MNIVIPLGGKGERFARQGYTQPKPLIPILDKCMIQYVLDTQTSDKVFILYNKSLDTHDFRSFIRSRYPHVELIPVDDTRGAAHTLYLGIEEIRRGYSYHEKTLVLDCDTYYTEDISFIFQNSHDNMVFYTHNTETNPVYSYISMNEDRSITDIREKEKISDNANTGAYAFTSIDTLSQFCKHVLDNNIVFQGEPYTSCVISEMIKQGHRVLGHELTGSAMISLGTPDAIQSYIDNTYAFLFDLDGSLVITDDIYYDVWMEILQQYNIVLTPELFASVIRGNNDRTVVDMLLLPVNVEDISRRKDDLFIQNIRRLKVVPEAPEFLQQVRKRGHKACVVTNCNRRCATAIVDRIGIGRYLDFIVTSEECTYGKPHEEPYQTAIGRYKISPSKCFIFEDSKSGLLSGKRVNPKLLVGIETNYSSQELRNYGADMSVRDFSEIDIELCITKTSRNPLISQILGSTVVQDIRNVVIDDTKLKGGFIADVVSFKIMTQDNTTYSQVLKYETNRDNDLSSMATKLDLYNREYYFYTHIASRIDCIRLPKFHNLVRDVDKRPCGIVLENLKEKNLVLNRNLNEEPIDLTLTVVDRMARMHAMFWNKHLKKMFPELKTSQSFHPFFGEFIAERRNTFSDKWYKLFTPNQIQLCNTIFDTFTDIQARFSQGSHLTFIHGDIKSPNLFYDRDEPYFIDWQHCAIGKGVQDLIFFVLESFDLKNIGWVFELSTRYYYRKLVELGIQNYSPEEYQRDLYDAVCYVPFFTSVWFGTVPQDELIDKNFPYFFIQKMVHLLTMLK